MEGKSLGSKNRLGHPCRSSKRPHKSQPRDAPATQNTHRHLQIYHFGATNITAAKRATQGDLDDVRNFGAAVNEQHEGSTVLVGEYTLAGINSTYQDWARWNVHSWATGTGLAGSAVWNFDAPDNAWSVVGEEKHLGVRWREVFSARGVEET